MYALLTAFVLLQGPATPAPGSTAPTLELEPPQIMTMPGQPFRVRAKTNAAKAFFDVEGPTSLPDDWPITDRKTTYYGFAPSANGTYTITVTVYGGDERVIRKCLVIVGSQPTPPGPGPVPPAPNDPLAAELQALFSKDKGQDKKDKLVSLWQSAIPQVLDNPEHATIRQFAETMAATGGRFPFNLVRDDLHSIRTKLADELATACGGASAVLGAPKSECRVKAAALLERYAAALGACK